MVGIFAIVPSIFSHPRCPLQLLHGFLDPLPKIGAYSVLGQPGGPVVSSMLSNKSRYSAFALSKLSFSMRIDNMFLPTKRVAK